MPKNNGKDNFSISVDPRAMEALQVVADRKYFGNRSIAAEKAIWTFVMTELAADPDTRSLIYNTLTDDAN